MNWQEVIVEKAVQYGFEPCRVTSAGRLYLIFPKQPAKEVENEIRAIIPETGSYEILVRPTDADRGIVYGRCQDGWRHGVSRDHSEGQ